jgi:hypothetical protein
MWQLWVPLSKNAINPDYAATKAAAVKKLVLGSLSSKLTPACVTLLAKL